jgi:hypothetical protein
MKQKSGLAFHCHHDRLIEFVYDYDKRVEVIKRSKSPKEQELRLRLFQMIPLDKLPSKGLEDYIKAEVAYNEAREAHNKAWQACVEAEEACDKAREAYNNKNRSALEKLHSELCPDCPWDGETIFTRKDKIGNWY